MSDPIKVIDRAMVRVRRRQSRRSFAAAQQTNNGGASAAVIELLDAVAAAEARQDPEPTVTELARHLGVDQPRTSKLVADGVAGKFLRRVADQSDGRRSRLALTPAGRAQLGRVHRYRQARFSAATADWTDRERQQFAALLTRFVDALDADER